MMVPLSSKVASHVRFLLQSPSDSDYDSIFRELCECTRYGTEGDILLLQTCFDHLDISGGGLKNTKMHPIYASLFRYLLDRPNFNTVLCESLRTIAVTEEVLQNLSSALHLSVTERIRIGLALVDSQNIDHAKCGKNFCVGQIVELCANPVPLESTELIQRIIMFLSLSEGCSELLDSFSRMLSLNQPKHGAEFSVSLLLPTKSHEENFFRLVNSFNDDDVDAVLAEMEKEMSMADVMNELGCGFTINETHCKQVLSLFLPLSDATISKILGTVVRSYAGVEDNQNVFTTFRSALDGNNVPDQPAMNSWNVNVLVDSIKQLAPEVNWENVLEKLDHEGFGIPDERAFSLLMSIYKYACQDPFPLRAVCGFIWRNVEGQLSFLKYAVSSPPEVFTFAHSERKLANADAMAGVPFQHGLENQAWSCIDLLEVLCHIAERGHVNFVRSLLEIPLRQCPEVLLLGIAHVNTSYNPIQYEVASVLIPMVLKSATCNNIVLNLFHVNASMLLRGFIDALNLESDNIYLIVDACQDVKILPRVLDLIPYHFGIRLATLSSKKEFIDLETWIDNNLLMNRDTFYEECIKFLKDVHIASQDVSANRFHPPTSLLHIYLEACPIVAKVLQSHAGMVSSSHFSEEMEKFDVNYIRANSKAKNNGGQDLSSNSYAEDVEAEANLYFHQLFSGQLSLDSMIQKLARFKESSENREQSVFECMIANLFEEYKFFSKYPDRQLKFAAVLFGSLIKNQLVTHLTLGIALRGVLDALRKPADSKIFGFGIKALEQFVDRLVEWPQYCNHILQISHLRAAHPELVAFIERALNRISSAHAETDSVHNVTSDHTPSQTSVPTLDIQASSFSQIGAGSLHVGTQLPSPIQLPQRPISSMDERKVSATQSSFVKPAAVPTSDAAVNKAQSGVGGSAAHSASPGIPRSSRASSTRFGSAINIETLVAAAERRETPIEAPPLEIQDKISFIINNLATTNMEAKAKEFLEIMNEQYYPWFAQYIVMKRTSIETNFHDLYLKFLDKVNLKPLNREIVKATYENCKVLLGSDLIKSTAEERSLLKNLGSWLGKITVGKNQVLRAREIDPKSIIIEAYEKGLMIAVIPFCSKVLESCSHSLAYQPPNPWTIGILGLLAEIYAMPNLKMNLKFEIEVLFKNLGVDLKDVLPTSLLKDRIREVEGNPDFSTKDAASSQAQVVNDVKPVIMPTISEVEIPLDITGPPHPGGHSRMVSQFAPRLHHSSGALAEDEKLVGLGFSDQIPSAHGLLQGHSQIPLNQLPVPEANIDQQVVINKKLQSFNLHVHFKSVLPLIMDRSVKEIMANIVQQSVHIAIKTTRDLVLKDYAMELDETVIRNAAHLMVARLAGSLAHVTCKEHLRGLISKQLRGTLQGSNLTNELIEQAIQLVTNDNLDLGCVLIEQAATEKALQSVDKEIAQQLAIRRKHRETVGSTFVDASLFAHGQMGALPEALRPRPGHLSLSQQRVYEDFARFPALNRSGQSSNAVPIGPSGSSSSSLVSRLVSSTSGQVSPVVYSSGSVNTGLGEVPQSLEIGADDIDPFSAQIPSVSLPLVAGKESPQSLDVEAVSSFPAASNSDLPAMEPSAPVKESGSALQPVNAAIGSERTNITEPMLTTGDALDKYQIISEKLDNLLKNDSKEADIQGVVAEVPAVIIRCISRDEAALAVAQKAFKGLYENASNNAHVSAHLAILAAIRDVSKLVVKELTSWVIYSEEDRKFNKYITIGLIRSELLNLAEYNVHMAKLIDAGRNKAATEFAISLIQTLIVNDSNLVSELHSLVDALAKLAARPGSPESLQQLVEIAKNPAANAAVLSPGAATKEDGMRSARDKKLTGLPGASKEDYITTEVVDTDPAGFHDQVNRLFAEWYKICELPGANDAACAHYVLRLQQGGFLQGDEISDRFFRRIMELSVSHCLSFKVVNSSQSQSLQGHALSFLAIDIFAKLVFSILKFCPVDQGSSKLSLLPKVLAVTVKFIQKDAEDKRSSFNPRPFFRLFINWIADLCSLEPLVDGSNFQVLIALANTFHALQPLKVPGFSFAWLELVSHRTFMPKLLTTNAQKGWPYFHRLLMDLIHFMEPFIKNAELAESVHFLYKGTLRVLLVILHDFPEFFCDYHFSFCDVIPQSCIQMRNIILSAFPHNMKLPDPSTPNVKMELLPESSQPPRILCEVDACLKAKQMKNDVDEYLKARQQGSTFLSELKQKLLLSPTEAARAGTSYNVPLINSFVLYVGIQALQQIQVRSPGHSHSVAFMTSPALDIFQALNADLETEGRYLFLTAVANQLRFPNSHTHFFSFVILYLFSESNQEVIQEQITRVILERLVVNRPHPWGLLATFVELIRNPRYNFWGKSFTRSDPEVEHLFDSVSRTCGGPKYVEDGVFSGGGIADAMHPL